MIEVVPVYGGELNFDLFFHTFFDVLIYHLPLIVCLIVVGFCLWIINYIHGDSWGKRL